MAPRGIMSENLKYEIAKELGVLDTVRRGVVFPLETAENGSKAIEIAERSLMQIIDIKNRGNPGF